MALYVNIVVIIDVLLVSKSRDAIGGTGKSSINSWLMYCDAFEMHTLCAVDGFFFKWIFMVDAWVHIIKTYILQEAG